MLSYKDTKKSTVKVRFACKHSDPTKSAREVAQELDVSHTTVLQWRKRDTLVNENASHSGRKSLIDEDDMESVKQIFDMSMLSENWSRMVWVETGINYSKTWLRT